MLSKKSKIEQLPKSRERQCLSAAPPGSLCQTRTKLRGRLLVIRRGPSHRRARHAPAVPKNLVHLPEKPFSTASTHCDHSQTAPRAHDHGSWRFATCDMRLVSWAL